MKKLYKFVAEQWIEANDEVEAFDQFAYNANNLAVGAYCYEACSRCRRVLNGCTCDLTPSSRASLADGLRWD